MTVLPEHVERQPLSGTAVFFGALTGYGAFALLISLVAAFANGAHANQALSAATWSQLGTGGGIVTAVVLFVAWAAGGFVAARMAGHDGVRHGVWTFVVGVVLLTVVAAAVTWLPDTETILRNLRLLGIPVRRAEWRDAISIAGIGSLVGMALGALVGGRYGERRPAVAPAAVPAARPVPPVERLPVETPAAPAGDEEAEPFFVSDVLPEEAVSAAAVAEAAPALSHAGSAVSQPEEDPAPAWWSPEPDDEPEPVVAAEPALAVVEPEPVPAEPVVAERIEPEPVPPGPAVSSWWPDPGTTPSPEPEPEPAAARDNAWALPDDRPAEAGDDTEFAFPPSAPAPVGSVDAIDVESEPEPAPLGEHADWPHDRGAFQAPPDAGDEDVLQHEPATLFDDDDSREEEIRRRQREDAARAYRRIIDDK